MCGGEDFDEDVEEFILLFFEEFLHDGGIALTFAAVNADFGDGQEPEIGFIVVDDGVVEGVVEDVGDGQRNLRRAVGCFGW